MGSNPIGSTTSKQKCLTGLIFELKFNSLYMPTPTNFYRPSFTSFETNEQMYQAASDLAINHLLEITAEEGSARVALSGGKTPLPLYKSMFHNPLLEPSKVEVFQTDERFVEPTDELSNQKHIIESMGESYSELKGFYPIQTTSTITESLANYNEILDSLEIPQFDLTILGVGEDGHFASLFPNGDYLNSEQPLVISTIAQSPNPVRERISISPQTILNSKMILVLLVGTSKNHIVPEILEGKKTALEFPAKFLLCNPNVYILESFED
jgi:6-phosphogluconolactonase